MRDSRYDPQPGDVLTFEQGTLMVDYTVDCMEGRDVLYRSCRFGGKEVRLRKSIDIWREKTKAEPGYQGYRKVSRGYELTNCTNVLLSKISNKRMVKSDIARMYFLAMFTSSPTDWGRVNRAIIERWSRSVLEDIKRLTHKGLNHVGRHKMLEVKL